MPNKETLRKLIEWQGRTYSSELGIRLEKNTDEEVFKWFLASILFGARISENIVKNTYYQFREANLLSPRAIVDAGWDRLVQVLDSGGYVRYDFKTADKLLEVMGNLLTLYQGSLLKLHEQARDAHDLELRIQGLGKGIGEVTTQIFLRELRGIWKKAQPPLSTFARQSARSLGWLNGESDSLMKLLQFWKQDGQNENDFPVMEAALVRVGKNYCHKRKCRECHLLDDCQYPVL